jgi:hypothetical protein
VTAILGACLILAVLVGGVVLVAYRMWVGALDALALAVKTGAPHPTSAVDWPELKLDAVLPEPRCGDVLVVARWPAQPENRSVLLLRIVSGADLERLARWSQRRNSLSPLRWGTDGLELRRRGSVQRVQAIVLCEDGAPVGRGEQA